MEFLNKEYLLLLLLLIPYLIWYLLYRKKSEPTMQMSDTNAYRYAPKSLRQQLVWLPDFLRMLTFVLVVLALARPQTHSSWGQRTTEGIDIMLAMDVSTSMLAQDHTSLLNLLQNVRTDIAARGLIEDGTAVGMGLANAVSRLKESKTKSKVVILLTDGSNNMGDISPLTAAQIAKSLGIRVYTIAVGTKGVAPYPMMVGGSVQYINVKADVDTETLTQIASMADGHFYRATSTAELKQIYKDIDKLEKTKMNVKKFSRHYEAYQPFALMAFITLLIEILLRVTWFRRIP